MHFLECALLGTEAPLARRARDDTLSVSTMLCGTKLPIYVPLLFTGGMHTIPDATYAPSGGGGHSRLAATSYRGGGCTVAKSLVNTYRSYV